MRAILLVIFIALSFGLNAQSYISASADMKVDASGFIEYTSPVFTVKGTYDPTIQSFMVLLSFFETNAFDSSIGEHRLVFTKAEVDAFTGTGTGDTAKAQNALEKCVVDYLEDINGAIFTIN